MPECDIFDRPLGEGAEPCGKCEAHPAIHGWGLCPACMVDDE